MTKAPTKSDSTPNALFRGLRWWFKRHPIVGALVLTVVLGLALGWNWLATRGLLIVTLVGLGCLLMCFFGLHGGRDKGRDGN